MGWAPACDAGLTDVERVRAAAMKHPIPFCSIKNDSLSRLTIGELRIVVAYFAVSADTAGRKADLLKLIEVATAERCPWVDRRPAPRT